VLGRLGTWVAVLVIVLFAALTHLRAREWDHPVRFALAEAAKHPRSPRATYDLARTLVVLGRFDPDSPYTREAFPALERARVAPGAGVLPVQALLLLSARTGQPLERRWWDELQAKLRAGPVGPQHNAALGSLTSCAIQRLCAFPVADMQDTFAAALATRRRAEVLNIYGSYVLNVLGDAPLAPTRASRNSATTWPATTSPGAGPTRRARRLQACARWDGWGRMKRPRASSRRNCKGAQRRTRVPNLDPQGPVVRR
jgi:protein O-mannosyl-transferase